MITLTTLTKDHVEFFRHMEGTFFHGADEVALQEVIRGSVGFALLEDGSVMGCCGVIKMWKGVGTWWMMATEPLRDRPRLLLSTAREVVDLIAEHHHYHRFEVFMDPEKTRHIRFIEALGFTLEGRLVKHTVDGTDHLLYAKTY